MEISNFRQYCEEKVQDGELLAKRFVTAKNPLEKAIEEGRRQGLPKELLVSVIEKGKTSGDLPQNYKLRTYKEKK